MEQVLEAAQLMQKEASSKRVGQGSQVNIILEGKKESTWYMYLKAKKESTWHLHLKESTKNGAESQQQ